MISRSSFRLDELGSMISAGLSVKDVVRWTDLDELSSSECSFESFWTRLEGAGFGGTYPDFSAFAVRLEAIFGTAAVDTGRYSSCTFCFFPVEIESLVGEAKIISQRTGRRSSWDQ